MPTKDAPKGMSIEIVPKCANHGNTRYQMTPVPGEEGVYICEKSVKVEPRVHLSSHSHRPCGNSVSLNIDNADSLHPNSN